MFTRKLLPAAIALCLCLSCSDDKNEALKTPSDLLTNGSEKKWKIVFDSSDEEEDRPSCRVTADRMQDNVFIFKVNEDFEFDNGTNVGDEECEDCCTDTLDLYGYLKLTTDSLNLVAMGLIVGGEREPAGEDIEYISGKLESLTENELILSRFGQSIKMIPVD